MVSKEGARSPAAHRADRTVSVEDWTMTYRAPVNEMLFMMRHVGEIERAIDEGIYADLSLDVVENILQEAARFSGEVLAPINRSGDRHGAQLRDGVVTTAPGFKEAYQAWIGAGWNALAGPAEYGGGGPPPPLQARRSEKGDGGGPAFRGSPPFALCGGGGRAGPGRGNLSQRDPGKIGARGWAGLAAWRGTSRARLHVHHDEQRAPVGRAAGRRGRRARVPGRRRFRRRAPPRCLTQP